MVRPKKPTHWVDLPRDCWEKIFSMYVESAAPERSGIPEMPHVTDRLVRWHFDAMGRIPNQDTLARLTWEKLRKQRSDHVRSCARTLIGLRSVCKLFREILNQREIGGPIFDLMWSLVKKECGRFRVRLSVTDRRDMQNLLMSADSHAPPGMTAMQKIALACEMGCQCCDKRPLTRKVIWAFGVRICDECARNKTVFKSDLQQNALVRPEHYEGLPFDEVSVADLAMFNFHLVRVKRYWKASVIKMREVTAERDKRLRQESQMANKKAEKDKKKNARLALQSKLDNLRVERKHKMTTILGKHVRDLSALETSETFRKFSAVARPLSVEFETRHMRKILSELPNEALAPHAQR